MKTPLFLQRIRNEWPKYLLFIFWFAINIFAFTIIFVQFMDGLNYFYLRKILKVGIAFAKASGIVININCCIILFLVCRNFISYLRRMLCCCPTNAVRIIDRHVSYHRYLGYIILIFSTIHTLAHIINFENFVYANDKTITYINSTLNASDSDKYRSLLLTLSQLPADNVYPLYLLGGKNNQYLNPVRVANSNTILEGLKLASGITGIVMCVALAVLFSSSTELIRRSFYNLFWYLHQICAVIFFLGFVTHSISGIVAIQTNTNRHDPQKCYKLYSQWPYQNADNTIVCDIPTFTGSMPTSWLYVIVPILVYLSERLIRLIRGLRPRKIAYYTLHPSNVLEIAIENSKSNRIKYETGQYIYLKVKSLSLFEWHPFTITSAPDDENLTVHIRAEGDWTKMLMEKIQRKGDVSKETRRSPAFDHISVDGPYGSSAEDIFKYKEVMLIGAGIGVTPYASILQHILNKIEKAPKTIEIEKVRFYWICQNTKQFEWFAERLKKLESQLINNNMSHLVDYNIFVTRWEEKDIKKIIDNDSEQRDLYLNIIQKANYGRPPFDEIFEDISKGRLPTSPDKIGVFFCGNPQISSNLHRICNTYSINGVKFRYNKESF